MNKDRPFDLQDRLVVYAVRIIKLSEKLPDTKPGKHQEKQEALATPVLDIGHSMLDIGYSITEKKLRLDRIGATINFEP